MTTRAAAYRAILKQREQRDAIFGADLFGEPMWALLLWLAVAREEQRRVSVTAACSYSGAPNTTGLRYLGIAVEGGLVIRKPDPADRRRSWIELTPLAIAGLDLLFTQPQRAAILPATNGAFGSSPGGLIPSAGAATSSFHSSVSSHGEQRDHG